MLATDGHLPYPYGREITGYEVTNLSDTLSKAKAAGATILVDPYTADSAVRRSSRSPAATSPRSILQVGTRPSADHFTEDLKKITVLVHSEDDQIVPYVAIGPLSAKLWKNGTLKTHKDFPRTACPQRRRTRSTPTCSPSP